MKRLALGILMLLGVALIGSSRSHAQQWVPGPVNGLCFLQPYNTVTPCPASPSPTLALPSPIKRLDVSAANTGPANTTAWDITITSKAACTPLNEPIYLYTMGNPGVGAFTQFYPAYVPSKGAPVEVRVDQRAESPRAGEAGLTLEVFNAGVGPFGLNIKAVWPQEGVERLVQLIAPATPTTTPTLAPGQPTNTAVPVTPSPSETPIPTDTATPSGLPEPTGTATPYPTPRPGTFFVHACVDPLIISGSTLGGGSATLFAQTVPGAYCVPSIHFGSGGGPIDPTYLAAAAAGQTADANGLVSFPFAENVGGSYGIAAVTCGLGTQSSTGYTFFYIRQTLPPGPEPGGLCPASSGTGTQAAADVNQLNPPDGSTETVSACFSVDGVGIPNVPMLAVYHYQNQDGFCTATTDSGGNAACSQTIGAAKPGYPVVVEVLFNYKGVTYRAVSEFTPA